MNLILKIENKLRFGWGVFCFAFLWQGFFSSGITHLMKLQCSCSFSTKTGCFLEDLALSLQFITPSKAP